MEKPPHNPVLLDEWLDLLPETLNSHVDGTLGAGGHARAVLTSHPELQLFLGIDQDKNALEIAKSTLAPWEKKVRLAHGNFRSLGTILSLQRMQSVDSILLDIGVSSMQLDSPERGFSFRFDGPLDMRMDSNQKLSAEILVNEWPPEELGRIFRTYGEEPRWRKAVEAICRVRALGRITTTAHLAEILENALPQGKRRHLHPATLLFQALRIAVNDELGAIAEVIPQAIAALAPGGILSVITFHSIEDRIVKNAFRTAASDKVSPFGIGGVFLDKEPQVDLVKRKAIKPSEKEIASNPRSRSARLRVVRKR